MSDNVRILYHEPFASVEWEGKTVCLYRDMEKTRKQLLEISPEDADVINQLMKDVYALTKIQIPITDVKGVKI